MLRGRSVTKVHPVEVAENYDAQPAVELRVPDRRHLSWRPDHDDNHGPCGRTVALCAQGRTSALPLLCSGSGPRWPSAVTDRISTPTLAVITNPRRA
jgi:hypothetical protein